MISLSNCIIDKIQTMKDGSLKIVLVSRELPIKEMVALFTYSNKEAPEIMFEPEEDPKTPSKRLRDRLYVYFKNTKDGTNEEFEIFYKNILEKIGQKYLDKLN